TIALQGAPRPREGPSPPELSAGTTSIFFQPDLRTRGLVKGDRVSDPASRLPERPSLEQLRKQAKELSKADDIPLAAAQLALARKYGFESWPKLVHHVSSINPSGLGLYMRLADRVAAAYTLGDFTAIREINWELGTAFV